jgi:signal transduction histidine kinase
VIGLDKLIKFANPAAEKILGESKEHLIGDHFKYPFDLSGAKLISIQKSGLQIEVLAVETTWGNEPSVLLTLHDITALKDAEENLRKKNDELTTINKALDRFVYIISHDLKKPTANIIGLLSLYEKDIQNNNPTKGKLIYEKLTFSAHQLKQMIEDLLEQTKREISTDLSFELIDFKKIFKEVCNSMEQLINKENADIQTDFSGSHIIYYSYQDLKSVMSNLISNAIKYHKAGQRPEIFINTEKTPKGTVLTVKDNGIGIDLKANKDKLFKKYQRFSNQAEGTGLGLWIVKDTIEKNNGNLEIISEPGKGTTFRIYL